MLRKIILLSGFICVALSGKAWSQDAKKSSKAEKIQQASFKLENSVLYKISGNGLNKPSYILGTIHMICADMYDWSEKKENALKSSQQIAVELDMLDQSIATQLAMGMMAKDGKKLSSYFTETEQQELSKILKEKMGYTLEMLESMSPAILVSLLAQNSFDCNGSKTESYDMNILKKGKELGYPVVSLDDPSVQLGVLNSLSKDSTQFAKIKMQLNPETKDSMINASRTMTANLMQYYKNENLQDLEKFFSANSDFGSNLEQQLLNNRNTGWVPKIENLIKDKPAFIAVGIGHFFGETGILKLLSDKGYKVEPVYK